MADWTTITDSQVDPNAPVTSELMSALRDNPVAIAEGAAGAPKIDPFAAFAHGGNVGQVGTYAMLAILVDGSNTEGTTRAGSQLGYSDASGVSRSAGLSGTWRCMGRASRTGTAPDPVIYNPGLWLRIS